MVGLAVALGGCGPNGPDPTDTQILARIKSPDGTLEAVLANDVGGGAAVGTLHEVFVTKTGDFPIQTEKVLGKECVRNISIEWEAPRVLKVEYDEGSDIPDESALEHPSTSSMFSSAYWVYSHPHGTDVRLRRHLTPPNGC
jgi:hypothetical protein